MDLAQLYGIVPLFSNRVATAVAALSHGKLQIHVEIAVMMIFRLFPRSR